MFEIKAVSPEVLVISVDASRLFAAIEAVQPSPVELKPPEDAEVVKRAHAAVTAMQASGVPLDQKLSVGQVLFGFHNESLKVFASEKPVTPGEGLVVGK